MTLWNIDADRNDEYVDKEPENQIQIEFKLNSVRLENRLLMPSSVVKNKTLITSLLNRDENVNDSSMECFTSQIYNVRES